jgi:hypothetical protein
VFIQTQYRAQMAETYPWPAHLDGVIAAPDHHHVIFENDEVRVLKTVVPAGDTTPVHWHPKTLMYVVTGKDFVRWSDSGEVMFDSREQPEGWELPEVLWSESTPPHKLWNPSEVDLVVIGVEHKS